MIPFAIIGLQRSGTTFLRRSLDDHPDIACYGEIFQPRRMVNLQGVAGIDEMPSKEERDADPIGYLDRFLSLFADGFIGFKLLLAQSPEVMEEVARRGYRLISLRRENALAKYSSTMIFKSMKGTGERFLRPANEGPAAVRATFSAAAFEQYRARDRQQWAAFEAVRDRYRPPCCDIEYAELAWGDGLDRVLDFLGASRRSLDAGIVKQNSTDVISRFDNPRAVGAYLSSHGLDAWSHEGPPGGR
ncbi:MAG: sulfotransferase [Caulobacteraceae bacterium]